MPEQNTENTSKNAQPNTQMQPTTGGLSLMNTMDRIEGIKQFCRQTRDSYNTLFEAIDSDFRMSYTAVSHKHMLHLKQTFNDQTSVYVPDYRKKIEIDRRMKENDKLRRTHTPIYGFGNRPQEDQMPKLYDLTIDCQVILDNLGKENTTISVQEKLQDAFRVALVGGIYTNPREGAPNKDPAIVTIPSLSGTTDGGRSLKNDYREVFSQMVWSHIPASEQHEILKYRKENLDIVNQISL